MGVKPNIARVLVEMDLLKEYPEEVWMGNEEEGYYQKVKIERRPKFCGHCKKFGHKELECFKKNPQLHEKTLDPKGKAAAEVQVEKEPGTEGCDNANAPRGVVEGNCAVVQAVGLPNVQNAVQGQLGKGHSASSPVHQTKEVTVEGISVSAEAADQGEDHGPLGEVVLVEEENSGAEEESSYDKEYWEELDQFKSKFWEDYTKEREMGRDGLGQGQENVLLVGEEEEELRGIENTLGLDNSVSLPLNCQLMSEEASDEAIREKIEELVLGVATNSTEECYDRVLTEESWELPLQEVDGKQDNIEEAEVSLVKSTAEEQFLGSPMASEQRRYQQRIDPTSITKGNALDMVCMGFDMEFSQEVEALDLADKLTPPHKKNRRKSWGDEMQVEHDNKQKSKRGRKKKKEVEVKRSISLRRTRGKAKEIQEFEQ